MAKIFSVLLVLVTAVMLVAETPKEIPAEEKNKVLVKQVEAYRVLLKITEMQKNLPALQQQLDQMNAELLRMQLDLEKKYGSNGWGLDADLNWMAKSEKGK